MFNSNMEEELKEVLKDIQNTIEMIEKIEQNLPKFKEILQKCLEIVEQKKILELKEFEEEFFEQPDWVEDDFFYNALEDFEDFEFNLKEYLKT